MTRYTIDQITKMMQDLMAEGYLFDYWTISKGWWIKSDGGRFGIRLGDPKDFNLAIIAAYEYRQYIGGTR